MSKWVSQQWRLIPGFEHTGIMITINKQIRRPVSGGGYKTPHHKVTTIGLLDKDGEPTTIKMLDAIRLAFSDVKNINRLNIDRQDMKHGTTPSIYILDALTGEIFEINTVVQFRSKTTFTEIYTTDQLKEILEIGYYRGYYLSLTIVGLPPLYNTSTCFLDRLAGLASPNKLWLTHTNKFLNEITLIPSRDSLIDKLGLTQINDLSTGVYERAGVRYMELNYFRKHSRCSDKDLAEHLIERQLDVIIKSKYNIYIPEEL